MCTSENFICSHLLWLVLQKHVRIHVHTVLVSAHVAGLSLFGHLVHHLNLFMFMGFLVLRSASALFGHFRFEQLVVMIARVFGAHLVLGIGDLVMLFGLFWLRFTILFVSDVCGRRMFPLPSGNCVVERRQYFFVQCIGVL